LGIGTNAPNSLLNVIGTGGVSGIRVNTSGADSWMPFTDGNWYVRSNGVIINDNNTAGVSIGINSPTTARLFVKGSGATSSTTSLLVQNSNTSSSLAVLDNGAVGIGLANPSASLHIKGSGSTGATTSLLVQNSAASTSLQLTDDGRLNLPLTGSSNRSSIVGGNYVAFQGNSNKLIGIEPSGFVYFDNTNRFVVSNNGDVTVYGELNMNSTTKGFLPPRMTTTQKNAIASPAAGLVVYDTTLNKLCVYTTAWETITSV
jgi:hypothetical protein